MHFMSDAAIGRSAAAGVFARLDAGEPVPVREVYRALEATTGRQVRIVVFEGWAGPAPRARRYRRTIALAG